MRFDIHTHVGLFPTSFRSKTDNPDLTPEETAEYLLENGITHHVCLYPRDDYHLMERLAELAPDVTHWGVQVVMGKTPEDADYIENLKLDYNDPNKPLCKGVKIASHRGYWKRKKKVYEKIPSLTGTNYYELKEVEEIVSGLDYGKFQSKIKKHILDMLNPNALVSFHLQGDALKNSGSTPMHVSQMTYQYPWLKFIYNHIGDYGPPSQAGKHTKHIYVSKTGDDVNPFPAFRHAHSRQVINSAIEFSKWLPNTMMDTSCFLAQKAEMLKDHPRWCIGSDWPAGKKTITQISEEKKFVKLLGEERVQESYRYAVDWVEKDWKVLYKEHVEENNMNDDIETVLRIIDGKLCS